VTISSNLDPPFAIFIGLGAAVTRIRREEKEKGFGTDDTIRSLFRRIGWPKEWRGKWT
jgi:hypothetical protein